VKDPLVSKSIGTAPKASVKKVYEYDLQTEAGKDYLIGQIGTRIEETLSDSPSMGRGLFNLQGQRISISSDPSAPSALPKGVYIINGEKVFVK
jgi:hypothetical protein